MKPVNQPLKSSASEHEEHMTAIKTVCAGVLSLSC